MKTTLEEHEVTFLFEYQGIYYSCYAEGRCRGEYKDDYVQVDLDHLYVETTTDGHMVTNQEIREQCAMQAEEELYEKYTATETPQIMKP